MFILNFLENKPCPTNVLQSCETLEDFEAWKREVLKQACEELGDPNMCYESKNNTSDKSGVKLIFPFK